MAGKVTVRPIDRRGALLVASWDMVAPGKPFWARAAWAALGILHAYLGILHLLALPGEWQFDDVWKGFGAAGGALLMLWWACQSARGCRRA